MKNLSTGTGLCIAGLCVVAFPFAQKLASVESQAHAGIQASAMTAVASTATAQVTPTIVWYQAVARYGGYGYWLVRAWSDGKVESRWCNTNNSTLENCSGFGNPPCFGNWVVVSDANMGYTAASDINFDAKVDGADLGQLLADWGDAPRQDIPPSDCPLALINP
jgi:hypothetical protein